MLSKRLEKIAKYLVKPIKFADIGSDHAYLPCYVCLQDATAIAIAGEINQGPYLRAIETVTTNQLENRIHVRKGNGLEVVNEGEVSQITIAGMGGKLIKNILEEGKSKLTGVKRLILQPNLDADIVRKWLYQHRYALIAEEIIEEDGYIYEILVAEQVHFTPRITEKELMFGPFLLNENNSIFQKKWWRERDKKEILLNEMRKATHTPNEKIQQFTKEIRLIEEVVDDGNNS